MAAITRAQLDVYLKYGGDSDHWARSASPEERKIISDGQWAAIEHLRLELGLLKRGQLGDEGRRRLHDSLAGRVADDDVIPRLTAAA
jgi:hypothetical protein